MTDIELVIKISEEEYINIKNATNSLIDNGIERASMSKVCLAILDGTPLNEILDKIRGEIKELEYLNIEDGSDGYDKYIEQYEVLQIIDKYRTESGR